MQEKTENFITKYKPSNIINHQPAKNKLRKKKQYSIQPVDIIIFDHRCTISS